MSDALVLTPRHAAELLGVDHTTIRRWVRDGACPNVFAHLPGTRIGVPRWWVDRIISPPPSVVVGVEAGGGAASPSAAAECGTPTLRTVPGVAAPGAA